MTSLLEPGQTAVVAVNGAFGQRLADMAERTGAEVIRIEQAWGEPVDPALVEAALWARGAKLLAFVHAETSTGCLTEPGPLCALAREHGALSVVDCVTSLGGIEVDADGWGADLVFSASQKCLSSTPGVAPLAIGAAALDAIRARSAKPQSWLLDLSLLVDFWTPKDGHGHSYPFTPPTHDLYALHEALAVLFEEGLEAAFARHRRMHEALASGLAALGLDFHVARGHRLPQLNAVRIPESLDDARVRARMLERYGVEIGAGLGPLAGRIWRIGLMGASATPEHVRLCLTALGDALSADGFHTSIRDALDAAEARLG
jgi:alanine-glyoxylate transaminase/serine-glyoxylate transaminase/serine-pyruvate transaminase